MPNDEHNILSEARQIIYLQKNKQKKATYIIKPLFCS